MSKELNKAPVEQAGTNVGHGHVFPRADGVKMRCGGPGLCSECAADASRARAALAQPSPAPADEKPGDSILCYGCFAKGVGPDHFDEAGKCLAAQAEQAEAERPEVVATMYTHNDDVDFREFVVVGNCDKGCEGFYGPEKLMTVAQHERIVGELRAKAAQLLEALEWRKKNQAGQRELLRSVTAERDSALARFAELEKQEPVAWVEVIDRDYGPYNFNGKRLLPKGKHQLYTAPVAHAKQLHNLDKQCRDDVARALGLRPSQERGFAWSYLLASIKSCVKASEDTAQAQHSVPETTNEEANSFLRVADAGQFKDNAAAVRTAAMIIRGLLHRPAIMKSIIRHRIGLTPEYEGQWHADLYGEDGEVQHHAEADTPDEAVRAVLAAAPGKEVGHE